MPTLLTSLNTLMSQTVAWQKISVSLTATVLAVTFPLGAWAETVLEKINRTGVITAGTRQDAAPFAFEQNGKFVGFSVELLELIRTRTEQELKKPIRLELVPVTTANRIPMVEQRQVDIECGATSRTWNRAKFVDFSVPFFLAGTQLLVGNNSSAQGPASLAGKKVGVIRGTTNEGALQNLQPPVTIVYVSNRLEGAEAVKAGKIDAFASDGVLLEGSLKQQNALSNFRIVPKTPIQSEAYACMVPQNQSDWRNLVDISLLQFMEGVVAEQPTAVSLYNRWFGPTGFIDYPKELNIQFYKGILTSQDRAPR